MEPHSRRREQLRRITATLLDPHAPKERLDRAASELEELFAGIAGQPLNPIDLELPGGRALSPVAAAACLRDGLRTAVFLRGVRDAVAARAGTCEVVYAGTGPFAPLVIPLMTQWGRGDVRCTLLDVHDDSVRSVQSLIDFFGFHELVSGVTQHDAATYRHDRPIDVVVAEVMQRALTAEPQVRIVRNLSRQLSARGALVPEEITVDVGVAPRQWVHDRAAATFETIGNVLRLNARAFDGEREVIMPRRTDDACIVYRTSVRAFGDHVLGEFDSGLTWPEPVWDLSSWEEGERITFWYDMGRSPGIRWKRTA